MSGAPKEKLEARHRAEETGDERELYLRDGRTLVLGEQGGDQLVEIRNGAGMVEVRIRLTEEGPVLQMEAARLSLKASEAVEIESKRVDIRATETVDVNAQDNIVIIGKTIHLNPDK